MGRMGVDPLSSSCNERRKRFMDSNVTHEALPSGFDAGERRTRCVTIRSKSTKIPGMNVNIVLPPIVNILELKKSNQIKSKIFVFFNIFNLMNLIYFGCDCAVFAFHSQYRSFSSLEFSLSFHPCCAVRCHRHPLDPSPIAPCFPASPTLPQNNLRSTATLAGTCEPESDPV